MATLTLKCRNCGRVYSYQTPYATYVGKVGETESTPSGGGAPRSLHPACPNCTSHACAIIGQS